MKFSIQYSVTVRVSKTITANSLDDALACGKAVATADPVTEKLIKLGPGVEYLWPEETKLEGVSVA